jgi:hypothetical protein
VTVIFWNEAARLCSLQGQRRMRHWKRQSYRMKADWIAAGFVLATTRLRAFQVAPRSQ